jgi:hypothetical protein
MDAVNWRKASYSGNGEACIEVAAAAPVPGRVLVRDTTDRDGGTLGFTPGAWQTFLEAIR